MAKEANDAAKQAGGKEPKGKEPKGKGKKSKKKLIILLVLVLGIGGFGYKTMTKKPALPMKGPVAVTGGPTVVENSLTVNLRDNHYLQFTVALQFAHGKSAKSLDKFAPQVTDILIKQASDMTETELLVPGGTQELKSSIIRALGALWPGLVVAVYFEQFVMQ